MPATVRCPKTPSPGERVSPKATGEERRQNQHRNRSDRSCNSQVAARIPHPTLRTVEDADPYRAPSPLAVPGSA